MFEVGTPYYPGVCRACCYTGREDRNWALWGLLGDVWMLRRLVGCLGLISLLSLTPVCGGATESPWQDSLVASIDSVLSEPAMAGGRMGVIVEHVKTGERWYSRNADGYFMPASNLKLVTSAAAISLLGPSFRYATCLLAGLPVGKRSTTVSDLVVRGSGDPLLTDTDLGELAKSLRSAGIRRVSGRVLVDDSAFDNIGYGDGWSWDDMSYYYSARVSALNLNGNVITVRVAPGLSPGTRAIVSVAGSGGRLSIDNRASTAVAGSPDTVVVERELGRDCILVQGSIAVEAPAPGFHSEPITVSDPALYCGERLVLALRHVGIAVTGAVKRGVAPAHYSVLATHTSIPMSGILAKLNKPSDNLVAECLLKTLGAKTGGQGTWAAGRQVVYGWLPSTGASRDGIEMADGSGLSRQNLITPEVILRVLRYMAAGPNRDPFLASLPIAGVDGSLRNRMKGTAAEGNCRAKTGYVRYASSLSGYVTTAAGDPLVFVILMNQHHTANSVPRSVQDKLVALLAGLSTRPPIADAAKP